MQLPIEADAPTYQTFAKLCHPWSCSCLFACAGHYSVLVFAADKQFHMLILLESELACLSAADLFSPNILDS